MLTEEEYEKGQDCRKSGYPPCTRSGLYVFASYLAHSRTFITGGSAGELEAVAQCDMSLAIISLTEHCFRMAIHAKSM